MPDDSSSSDNHTLGVAQSSLFELAAKGITALGGAAIATAFIYDAVCFQWLDQRLLGYFSVSDHIETAVYCLVPIIASWGVFVLLAFLRMRTSHFGSSPMRPAYAVMSIAVAVGAVVGVAWLAGESWRPHDDRLQAFLFWLSGFAAAEWTSRQIASGNLRKLYVGFPIWWVVLTVLFASSAGRETLRQLSADNLAVIDTITLSDQGQLFGRVVRVLDRGVIVGTVKPPRLIFLPKDKISRVELGW